MATTRRHIFFSSGNLKLEGVLSFPEEALSCPGAVICHPHPAYGGDMNNNIVMGIKRALEAEGFVILRFNFRGVNLSEGRYDGGEGEMNDVMAAVSYVKAQPMVDDNRLFLAGYSFGAWVALRSTLKMSGLRAMTGISPPLGMLDFSFLADTFTPTLLVSGDQDIFCKVEDLESAFNTITSPKRKVILPDADHFYWGREEEIGEAVREFFSEYV